jgi:hypothetical protein
VHVTLTRVGTSEPGEAAAIVGEEMERWLRAVEGFDGFPMLSREGRSVGLTFWNSREPAEQQRPLGMDFLSRVLAVAGVELERCRPGRLLRRVDAFRRVEPSPRHAARTNGIRFGGRSGEERDDDSPIALPIPLPTDRDDGGLPQRSRQCC